MLSNFTNQYSLSKTLRFELKPVGPDGNRLSQEQAAEMFAEILEEDRKIKEAYIALKPVMDGIHEHIINASLTSEEAKNISYSEYFEEYKKGKNKNSDHLKILEKELRDAMNQTFEKIANEFADNAGNSEEGKPIFKKKKDKDVGVEYLTQAGILKYIENNIKTFVDKDKVEDFIYNKEVIEKTTGKNGKIKEKKKTESSGYLAELSGFFGYFTGYNQNRENYYVTKDEKATAVATRIVHDNLPKYCDNTLGFESRKDEYIGALKYLKDNNRTTQIKDAKTNIMIEAEGIGEERFKIEKFSECLAQEGIENYNRIIGHYNLLINLYNQACKDKKEFKKLSQFKTLDKQIGCGTQKALFDELNSDDELKNTFVSISNAGKKYFKKSTSEDEITIHGFMQWLKENEDWDGVYWSKTAVDKISNHYLANWHEIKDHIQGVLQSKDKTQKESKEALKSVASYDKKREEHLKLNDAVELSGLFLILDEQTNDNFFKESILEDKRIDENKTSSQNLISLVCEDIEKLANDFTKQSEHIVQISDYKNESNILTIKHWLDTVKSVLWLIKYFEVKESKVKGNSINPELTNMLTALLRAEDANWFNSYDLVRNYLSKKPQDDAKKNKLKLNFKNPTLLGGWSDGQEKNKGAVLLRNGHKQYVGVLIERNIFDTENEANPVYSEIETSSGRLILRNLAFKTLAGKGFVKKYNKKYSEIDSPIPKLQEFIKESYVAKYPLLKDVSEAKYTDKKIFDKAVQDALTECYECDFRPINWDKVLQFVQDGKMYLFELYSKDFSENKGEKSKESKLNLQTLYWQHIFEDNSTVQLNGGGEIFYREQVELKAEDKATHPANQKIRRRSDEKTESIFNHDIVKNRRFTENKFFFHVPIKINYQAPARANVNEAINDNFTKADDIQFLGIDRGEKHLIYYSLVNARGEIIKQDHLDVINKKDYLQAINKAAKDRKEKQENWQQKGNISNLKDGYISLAVHEIVEKMKDQDGNFKPTFMVLEDLNTGFKRGRQKFEQQVYQKFELALAKKLNYLVDKNAKMGEFGSVSKALQFTPQVSNYQDIENRKQVGIMLYTRANYTSITDPATGWRKTIYLKKGSETDIKNQIKESFDDIGVEGNDYFFQYKDKHGKEWKLWSSKAGKSLERYRSERGKDKNEFIIKSIDVKAILDKLFEKFDKSKSFKQQLEDKVELTKCKDKYTASESLRFAIDMIQQIRNSGDVNKNQDDNFLLSPIRNEQGVHFDSRKSGDKLPKDADANGAYNIARKGIVMYEHVKQWIADGKAKDDLDLFISDLEWDMWLADKKSWESKLKYFASKKAKTKE
jgi:CRISPR-associated protein Cpf1